MFYILIMVIGYATTSSMTSVPGFYDRASCDSAGASFLLEAKQEHRPRYYCIERRGTR